MKFIICLLLGIHASHAALHSWEAITTGSTGLSEFPEFVAVNLLNDEVMGYFDSKTNRYEGKQSWVEEKLGQQYVEWQTNTLRGNAQTSRVSIGILMERSNQSKGVHVVQVRCGCEWDEETGATKGYYQHGYNGEDFIIFDLENMRWIAPNPLAVITKQRWDHDRLLNEHRKHYLTQTCVEWLKKYVSYGKSSLERTVPPSVSVFQKSSSSPVTCHATGFYPRGVVMFWRRDGEEVMEDVHLGETLPNHDGTFQVRSTLNVSAEELKKHNYTCVVQHSSDKDRDIVSVVEDLWRNKGPDGPGLTGYIIGLVGVVVICIIAGVLFWWKKTDKKGFTPASSSDDGSHSSNSMAPKV